MHWFITEDPFDDKTMVMCKMRFQISEEYFVGNK